MELDNVIAVRPNKTVYRDGDAAIKVFDEGYSKADVLNEALNQARVEDTGLFVPKIREVTKIDGKWAIVSEFIEGKTLSALMEEHPEKYDEYLTQKYGDWRADLPVEQQIGHHFAEVIDLHRPYTDYIIPCGHGRIRIKNGQ